MKKYTYIDLNNSKHQTKLKFERNKTKEEFLNEIGKHLRFPSFHLYFRNIQSPEERREISVKLQLCYSYLSSLMKAPGNI